MRLLASAPVRPLSWPTYRAKSYFANRMSCCAGEPHHIGCGYTTGAGYGWLVCRYSPGGNKDGKPVPDGNGPARARLRLMSAPLRTCPHTRINIGMAKRGGSVRQLGDAQIADRLLAILINAAAGQRSVGDDSQYPNLRREIMRRDLEMPSFLLTHPSVDSFTASIKGVPNKAEREQRVRNDFHLLLRGLGIGVGSTVDSSAWTGEPSRTVRLKTVRTLLPLAQTAVDSMIATLSEPNANGAPLLQDREEAIEHLRKLHRTLGDLLAAIDGGHFDDELGQSLQAEAARYAKRTARALRDDPMPYLSSALLLGVLTACGLPGLGGYISGVALTVKKHTGR